MLTQNENLFTAAAATMRPTGTGGMGSLSYAFGLWEAAGLTINDALTGDYVARMIAAEMKADSYDDSTDVFFSAEDLEHLHAFAKVINDLSKMCDDCGELLTPSVIHDSLLVQVATDSTGTTIWDSYAHLGRVLHESQARVMIEARNAKGLPSTALKWNMLEHVNWENAALSWISHYRLHHIEDPWPNPSNPNTRRAVVTPASLIT